MIRLNRNSIALLLYRCLPDIIKNFKDMLYELDKNEYMDIHNAALGPQHLTDLVQEFLKNKRYVLSCALVQIITA